jgi:hypothetical protein
MIDSGSTYWALAELLLWLLERHDDGFGLID